jgi:hypothetical protein
MSQILWGYDDTNKSFSPFPASPFLLPVMGILAFAGLCAQIAKHLPEEIETTPAPEINTTLLEFYRQRYKELTSKKTCGIELNQQERLELLAIKNPPWAKPGETWTY